MFLNLQEMKDLSVVKLHTFSELEYLYFRPPPPPKNNNKKKNKKKKHPKKTKKQRTTTKKLNP